MNVGLGGRLAEWAGDVLRPDQDIVLVCEPGRELEAKVRLGRIGFDNVRGHLARPLQTLLDNPELVQRSSRLTASELAARRTAITDLVVVDVRNRGELERGAIPGSVHIPADVERVADRGRGTARTARSMRMESTASSTRGSAAARAAATIRSTGSTPGWSSCWFTCP